MSSTSNSKEEMSLKLFIDKSKRKILFAEADKSFIDFLFAILTLPISSILGLVPVGAKAGPFTNLYNSVENLDAVNYFQENHLKNNLLKPKLHIPKSRIPLFPINDFLLNKW
ncbi:hypothetical protein Csa_000321 [Cucumis sativus]|uniref:Uncharacterized protein n=1 Tax=Cucumis sativus TaxID=3659 RepID=A0A0A0KLT0_CUCSA|nr:hypothetical protein Csa_000321 [Cucumis sativus]